MADDPKIVVNEDGTATATLDFESTTHYTLSKCSCRPAFEDYQLSLIPQNYTVYDTIEGNFGLIPAWRFLDNAVKVLGTSAKEGVDSYVAEEQGGMDGDLNMLGGAFGTTNSTRTLMIWFYDNDHTGIGNSWYLHCTSNNTSPMTYISRFGFDTDDVTYPTVYQWYFSGGQLEITEIDTVADVSKSLNSKWFFFASHSTSYCVWFDVDNTGADPNPAPGVFTSLEVDISEDDDADTVAAALQAVLDGQADINASVSSNTVTTETGPSAGISDAVDINTGFSITVTQQGTSSHTGQTTRNPGWHYLVMIGSTQVTIDDKFYKQRIFLDGTELFSQDLTSPPAGINTQWKTFCTGDYDWNASQDHIFDEVCLSKDTSPFEEGTATIEIQPDCVEAWTSVTTDEDTTGAWRGSVTYEYRSSTDDGASWTAYKALTNANLQAETPDGDGLDIIEVKMTLTPSATADTVTKCHTPRVNNVVIDFTPRRKRKTLLGVGL